MTASSREAAFLAQMVALLSRALDVLFGSTLVSPRSLTASASLSLISGFICRAVLFLQFRFSWVMLLALPAYLVGIWLLARASAAHVLFLFGGLLLGFICSALLNDDIASIGTVSLGATLGVACDYLYISGTRFSLRRLEQSRSRRKLAPFIACYLLTAALFALWMLPSLSSRIAVSFQPNLGRAQRLVEALLFAGASNLFIVLSAALFLASGIGILLYPLVWPLILRPLYILQRWHILSNRKVLVAAGMFLVGLAFGGEPFLKALSTFVKKLS